jgi:hypothetical protein
MPEQQQEPIHIGRVEGGINWFLIANELQLPKWVV